MVSAHHEAATAAEAPIKTRAAQGRYDAVILDIALPDRQGGALAGEIRALYADMPLLIADGEHAAALRERFQGDRCARLLAKPYTGAILVGRRVS